MAAIQSEIGTLKNFIDGEWVEPSGGTDTVFNPATGEELAQAPLSTPEDVDRAVKAASNAFEGWSNTTPGERALALIRLADALEEHGEELAALEIANAGKPAAAFKSDELPVMADILRCFAGCAGARCCTARGSNTNPTTPSGARLTSTVHPS